MARAHYVGREPLPPITPSQYAVGVLYIVYAQNATSNDKFTAVERYLAEAASSARSSRANDPSLPAALATNVELVDEKSFSLVLRTVPKETAHLPLWMPRVLAIAASPFELTLALDSHATACTHGLHAALMREHQLNRLDLAVNFEATIGLRSQPARRRHGLWAMISSLWGAHARAHKRLPPPWRWPNRPGRDVAPQSFVEMLPHNWALLVRRSAGGRALLARWAFALRCANCGWTDQYALQAVLWYLNATRSAADQE